MARSQRCSGGDGHSQQRGLFLFFPFVVDCVRPPPRLSVGLAAVRDFFHFSNPHFHGGRTAERRRRHKKIFSAPAESRQSRGESPRFLVSPQWGAGGDTFLKSNAKQNIALNQSDVLHDFTDVYSIVFAIYQKLKSLSSPKLRGQRLAVPGWLFRLGDLRHGEMVLCLV